MNDTIFKISVKTIAGKDKTLAEYKGKVMLVVNTASECGFTPQYKGLQALFEKYHDRGLEVLGFPCNDFGAQEPGSEAQIASFCEGRFGVKFPMFGKVTVAGAGKHPLYLHLLKAAPTHDEVKWNFEKFLVGRDGAVLARFGSKVEPMSPELVGAIEKALG